MVQKNQKALQITMVFIKKCILFSVFLKKLINFQIEI